ncbi:MAG: metal ABC transporter permease [Planctomycetes bacterium]|nr:metal ABC transporter permease [Planctomycetota bacterium]
MLHDIFHHLSKWQPLDTWIVLTAALIGMACVLPGNFLLLRRQSMMGDALSHTTLPGIAMAFLLAQWLKSHGYVSPETYDAFWLTALFVGAVIIGLLTALLSEAVHSLGRVEASAALGVVFTSLFALGLILVRLVPGTDLDPDCVLYGAIEANAATNDGSAPSIFYVSGASLAINLVLLIAFFKELRISTFDPGLATAMGIHARAMHLGLMAVTAATLVVAFQSVGSILVIAMLIVPAATGRMLCDRLGPTIVVSLLVAALSAAAGHVMAISLPPLIFSRLGFAKVGSASTAGMMAVAAGGLLTAALAFAPRQGVVSRVLARAWMSIKIAGEDWLGVLYRQEELTAEMPGPQRSDPQRSGPQRSALPAPLVAQSSGLGAFISRLAVTRLRWQGKVVAAAEGYHLTELGRQEGRQLIRAHRLWETYLARNFPETATHLHESAHVAEHFVSPKIEEQLTAELDRPQQDPQGKSIPQ